MKILFVCSANKDRSKTAEDYFSGEYPKIEFISAGTNIKICKQEGTNPLTEDILKWAERVYVMEEKHRQWIKANIKGKYDYKITVLGVMDIYKYEQKELIDILCQKIVF